MQQDLYEAVIGIVGQYAGDNIHTSSPAKVGDVSDNFNAEVTPDLKITTDDNREVNLSQNLGFGYFNAYRSRRYDWICISGSFG